jgi:hypothetical protein
MFRFRSLAVGVAGLTREFFFGGMSTLGKRLAVWFSMAL